MEDSLELSEDDSKIIPEEGESNPGAGMWLRLLAKYFFASRGYSLDGRFRGRLTTMRTIAVASSPRASK